MNPRYYPEEKNRESGLRHLRGTRLFVNTVLREVLPSVLLGQDLPGSMIPTYQPEIRTRRSVMTFIRHRKTLHTIQPKENRDPELGTRDRELL